ncbi:hypothetical protein QQF64_008951 [Cirrhinus molitorella]|uniref:Uncharacterized protein n=1 Tax=Cirrhinus molitorella TaxID=172907 RepID=A0ABR3M7P5_9TELE
MNINPKLRSVILPSGLRLLVTKEHLHASHCCCLETNEEKQCLAYGSQFEILSDLGVLGYWVARFSERLESEKQLTILTTCCACGNGFQALSRAFAPLMSQRSPLCACETSDTNCARENNNFSVPLNSLPHRVPRNNGTFNYSLPSLSMSQHLDRAAPTRPLLS